MKIVINFNVSYNITQVIDVDSEIGSDELIDGLENGRYFTSYSMDNSCDVVEFLSDGAENVIGKIIDEILEDIVLEDFEVSQTDR